jgi:hypothetical protein
MVNGCPDTQLVPGDSVTRRTNKEIAVCLGVMWLVHSHHEGGDDRIGAYAQCRGKEKTTLIMQNSVATAPRFDLAEQDGDMPALLQLASHQSHHRWNHVSVRAGQHPKINAGVPLVPFLGETLSLGGVDVDRYRNDFAP